MLFLKEKSKMNVSWPQLLAGIFALTAAVAGATFTISKYAKEAEIAAYRLRIEMQDRRILELERRLNEKQIQTPITPTPGIGQPHKPKTRVVSVHILSPLKTVPQFADVRFALTGELPTGFKPLLAVRDPLGNWWSWGTTDSSTYYSVQFGTDVDRGKQFEIRVIVSDEDFPPNQPRRSLPKSVATSAVVVTRQ